jgi:DNA helicase HerA-like ATPase
VTLQRIAEQLSNAGVPVFLADAKGDLSGSAPPVSPRKSCKARLEKMGITDWQPRPTR